MIVIEGSDLVGKTTFVKQLVKVMNEELDLPHVPMHLGRLPASFDRVRHHMLLASPFTVWDRFHLSEPIYTVMTGREVRLFPEHYCMLESHLMLLGCYTVIITASDWVIEARYKTRYDDMYGLKQIQRVNELFGGVIDDSAHLLIHPDGHTWQLRHDYAFHVDRLEYDFTPYIEKILHHYARRQQAAHAAH